MAKHSMVYKKQYINPGESFSLSSLSNSQKYQPGVSKKWYFSTSSGYELQLTCPVVDMPKIGDECEDCIRVFYLKNNNTYCEPFHVSAPSIILQLKSTPWENGRVFACTVTSYQTSKEGKPPFRPEADCQCGYRFKGTPRIVGEETARINQIPSMALLVNSKRSYYCGATIIGPNVALSAAHCVDLPINPKSYKLIVGEHDTSRSDETNAEKYMVIRDVIIHSEYNPYMHGVNDVALLMTAEEIKFTTEVGPACLPINIGKESIIGKEVIAAGWRRLSQTLEPPKILQTFQLQVETDKNCKQSVGFAYSITQHICTITPRKNIVRGDSGGPLYYIDPKTDRYVLVGVTSFGNETKPTTGVVFMDVYHYLPWISENLPLDTQLCGDSNRIKLVKNF